MNIIAKYEEKLFITIGDIHEDFFLLKEKIKKYNLEDTILFVAGDFGVGFYHNNPREITKEKKRLELLNEFLKKRNIFIYVVRGNHDNPNFFDGKHNFSNLIFMEDYDVVEVGEHRILGIGGATSVDRKPNPNFPNMYGKTHKGRKEGINWWPEEKVVYDEEKLNDLVKIDVVISHICPDFVSPTVLSEYVLKWIEYDPELKDELFEERAIVSKIYNKLSELNYLKNWVFGHYHRSNCETYNLTKFRLLNIGEFVEIVI
jgi:UDP-2,3-diacylglucosamine pyrophosphatase LpxH